MPILIVALTCGGCAARFEANAHSVPKWHGLPACRGCWDKVNQLRVQANLDPWVCPEDAYLQPITI